MDTLQRQDHLGKRLIQKFKSFLWTPNHSQEHFRRTIIQHYSYNFIMKTLIEFFVFHWTIRKKVAELKDMVGHLQPVGKYGEIKKLFNFR